MQIADSKWEILRPHVESWGYAVEDTSTFEDVKVYESRLDFDSLFKKLGNACSNVEERRFSAALQASKNERALALSVRCVDLWAKRTK